MTTDLADEEFWLEIVLAPIENEHWALRLRPPAPKCTLFKDFLSINIKYFVEHAFLLEVLTFIWSPSGGRHDVVIWFYINIFRIHNQLKCHMILFLGKDIMAPVASLIVMTDTSGGLLLASDWSAEITWPEYWPLIGHCSHVMSLWSAETAYQGTLSWPGASCPGENILVTGG